jgi:hypothetical protein
MLKNLSHHVGLQASILMKAKGYIISRSILKNSRSNGFQIAFFTTSAHVAILYPCFLLVLLISTSIVATYYNAITSLSLYFLQVMCAIILLPLEPYLQVIPCSAYHVESFLKGLHSRFFPFLVNSFVHLYVL